MLWVIVGEIFDTEGTEYAVLSAEVQADDAETAKKVWYEKQKTVVDYPGVGVEYHAVYGPYDVA